MGLRRRAARRGRARAELPLNAVVRRLLPGALLLAGVAIFLLTPVGRARVVDALPTVPWIVFAAGVVLAWRFKRPNLVLALLVLALATVGIAVLPLAPSARAALAVLVPIDLAVLAWLPERRLFAPRGRVRLVVLAAEIGVVGSLSLPALAPVGRAVAAPLVAWAPARLGALAHSGVLALAIALAAVAGRVARTRRAEDTGTLWALIALALALGASSDTLGTAWLAAAGLTLVVALVEASYGMAYGDELTGLPARRALESELRYLGGRYAIAMVDVDHFKKFNDEHGHPIGDQLLRMVATGLASVGGGGRPFRYGGEEFAVLFPGKTTADVLPSLESVRRTIEAAPFVVRSRDRPLTRPERPSRSAGRRRVSVTVSIGVAAAGRTTTDPREVLDAADAALYRAKHAGRNRVST